MRRSTQRIDWDAVDEAVSAGCTWLVLVLGLALYGLCVALRRTAVVLLLVAVRGADWAAGGLSSLAAAAGETALAEVAGAARAEAMVTGAQARPAGDAAPYVVVIIATRRAWAEQPTGVWP